MYMAPAVVVSVFHVFKAIFNVIFFDKDTTLITTRYSIASFVIRSNLNTEVFSASISIFLFVGLLNVKLT